MDSARSSFDVARLSPRSSGEFGAASPASGLRVLLVEAGSGSGSDTAHALRHLGYCVTTVDCVAAAIAALGEAGPDLVLADADSLGGEITSRGARQLFAAARPLPVVLLGDGSEKQTLVAVRHGAADVVAKPPSRSKLALLWQHAVRAGLPPKPPAAPAAHEPSPLLAGLDGLELPGQLDLDFLLDLELQGAKGEPSLDDILLPSASASVEDGFFGATCSSEQLGNSDAFHDLDVSDTISSRTSASLADSGLRSHLSVRSLASARCGELTGAAAGAGAGAAATATVAQPSISALQHSLAGCAAAAAPAASPSAASAEASSSQLAWGSTGTPGQVWGMPMPAWATAPGIAVAPAAAASAPMAAPPMSAGMLWPGTWGMCWPLQGVAGMPWPWLGAGGWPAAGAAAAATGTQASALEAAPADTLAAAAATDGALCRAPNRASSMHTACSGLVLQDAVFAAC